MFAKARDNADRYVSLSAENHDKTFAGSAIRHSKGPFGASRCRCTLIDQAFDRSLRTLPLARREPEAAGMFSAPAAANTQRTRRHKARNNAARASGTRARARSTLVRLCGRYSDYFAECVFACHRQHSTAPYSSSFRRTFSSVEAAMPIACSSRRSRFASLPCAANRPPLAPCMVQRRSQQGCLKAAGAGVTKTARVHPLVLK